MKPFASLSIVTINGNNNIVLLYADGQQETHTIDAFISTITAEKDKRIADLKLTIEDKTKIEGYLDAEIQRLGRELTKAKEERHFLKQRIEEMLREFDGKDLSQASKMYQEAFSLFVSGNLEAAIDSLREDQIVPNEAQTQAIAQQNAQTRLLKADMLVLLFDFEKAAHNYEKAIESFPSWENHLAAANFYQNQKNYKKVERHYQLSLIYAKNENQKASTLNNLGVFYSDNQNIPQAEVAYLEALNIRRQLAKITPDAFLPDLATTLNNLGVIYGTNQKMAQAEDALNEALKIRRQLTEKKHGAFLSDLAMTLNNLGNFYHANQKMPQAEKAYLEALNLKEQLAEINPNSFLPDLAMTFNNLGIYYTENQKMPQAEDAFIKALEIREQLAKINPDAFLPDLATTLNNIGLYYCDNEKMQQAEDALNEALKIREQLAKINPNAFLPDLASTLNNLGIYYYYNKQIPQAEDAFNKALKIYRQFVEINLNASLYDVATTLNHLGNCYTDNQKMPEAEDAFSTALKIFKQLAKTNSDAFLPQIAGTLNNLGIYYYKIQKIPQAKDAFNKALKIRRQLAAKNPDAFLLFVAETLNNLGFLFKMTNNYKIGLKYYAEVLYIYETAILNGGIHMFNDWVETLRNVSDIKNSLLSIKDYKSTIYASRLLTEGYDKLKKVDENLTPNAVSEHGNLSWWALFVKDFVLSEESALRCLELDSSQEWVLTNLGHSQLLRGQYATAKATYEKLKGKKNGEGKDNKEVLLQDFIDLEAEGITNKDLKKIKGEVEKW